VRSNSPHVSRRPNILFILCDDHAAQAIGCYGCGLNSTPHIDRIAQQGMRFEHCYVTNSICTPSRATILTGTHNHINRVTTLHSHLDNRLPNVAKSLQAGGYQTAIFGKWHLGHGPHSDPKGFDAWSILPGQGEYRDPTFLGPDGPSRESGYVTDLITDKCLHWLEGRDPEKPFFLMCHQKAPHRPWDPNPKHRSHYMDPIPVPANFHDDYQNRARAAGDAKIRVSEDLTYRDLDLVESCESVRGSAPLGSSWKLPTDPTGLELRCAITGETFTFKSSKELKEFKYQRYLRKYLQCVHSIDENTGRLVDWMDDAGLAEETLVIYTSDQGFFLGEHGWFDKRFIYEESFRMPFLVRMPGVVEAGSICREMVSNVDFAQTFLDFAGLPQPGYMQGRSIRPLLEGHTPGDWPTLAYHRYWMNNDDIHNACAHYGIRTKDFKLIYWYDEALGEPGSNPGYREPEWELFDLRTDASEMCNLYKDPSYKETVRAMTGLLEAEMARIGDIPVHRD
jgi:arylsulfatase A-like enzyme